jgi:hypothetical protein
MNLILLYINIVFFCFTTCEKIKIFFNISLNILTKVDKLESLIKEIRDGLNSQKVNDTNQKKINELMLKQKNKMNGTMNF